MMSALPGMLGLTIAAFSIFLAVGDDNFKKIIRGPDEDGKPSPMMTAVSSFTHFAMIQAFALLSVVIFSFCRWESEGGKFFVIFIYVYALSLVVATIFAIYTIADTYDETAKYEDDS